MAEFAGSLRERITLERPLAERLETGVRESGWEPFGTCLAAVTLEGAGPESEGMALSAMPRFRVVIRSREGVEVDQRLRWRGRLLMIRQVLRNPCLPDRITLKCEEVRG